MTIKRKREYRNVQIATELIELFETYLQRPTSINHAALLNKIEKFQSGIYSSSIAANPYGDETSVELESEWTCDRILPQHVDYLESLGLNTFEGMLQTYTSGYPVVYLIDNSDACCPKCATAAIAEHLGEHDDLSGLSVTAMVNWENPELYCDHCSDRIESAYAEDDVID